jgi:5-methylcytosine-specific restriction endonuclease McrA
MVTEYNDLLSSAQWLEKRKIILSRDNNKCQCCGKVNGLQVHHRQYHIDKTSKEFRLPWDYQNKYLITLCDNCHSAGHSKFKVPTFII